MLSNQEIASEASNLALALRQTQDPVIQSLSTVTEKHIKHKDLIFRTFLGYLGSDSKLSELKDKQIDPKDPGSLVSKFILYTGGPKNKAKYSIVNSSLICFVQEHKMSKAASGVAGPYEYKYQSTSWDTMLKTLFSYFGEHGVQYKHPIDFMAGRGTYTAVLNHNFAMISKAGLDFGGLPNRSAIDMASFAKVREALREGWLKPYKNFSHLTMLVNCLMGVTFMLCGQEEQATLTWKNIRFSNVTSCKLMGRRKLEIVSLLEKTAQVSVTNPMRHDNTGVMDAVKCVNNHSTCVVHWAQYYQTLCPPGQV